MEWQENPRTLTNDQAEALGESMVKFGFVEPLVLNADGRSLIGGHARRRVLLQVLAVNPNVEVDVRIPSRALTEKERDELGIRLNKNTGSFDFDMLANDYDMGELQEWGFTPMDFGFGENNDADKKSDKKEEEGICSKCKRPL